ncbi:MAG: hypothetical protein V3R41_05995 [Gammaproteobacteria bacterium]
MESKTKEQLAEWLAENVLGGTQSSGIWVFMFPHFKNQVGMRISNEYLPAIIYSPDGFFAVKNRIFTIGYQFYRVWPIWDEQGEGLQVGIGEDYTTAKVYTGNYYYPKTGNDKEDLDNTKAEIEAFYNAVYEAMKP